MRKSIAMRDGVAGAFTTPTMKTVETSEMDALFSVDARIEGSAQVTTTRPSIIDSDQTDL